MLSKKHRSRAWCTAVICQQWLLASARIILSPSFRMTAGCVLASKVKLSVTRISPKQFQTRLCHHSIIALVYSTH